MSELSFLENIFSITNQGLYKQICFFGIKLKIRRKPAYSGEYDSLPIDENKIIFRTFNGAYNCNPKYIAEEILRQNLPYKLVWVVNKNILNFIKDYPENIKLVMSGTPEEIKETVTAKFIIDNERRTSYIKRGILKRSGQIYIQTFHGSLGIKKTGIDRKDANSYKLRICRKDSEQIDYLISNGSYTTDFFKRMFWNYGKIIESGHPRNDVFFKDNIEIKKKVYKYFNLQEDTKILLYAPTVREDHDMSCYSLDLEKLIPVLENKFGRHWVVITRLHPLLINYRDNFIKDNKNIIEGSQYSDMQELISTVDILVTDYSSCIYDFVLSGKPGFIYAADVKKYDNARGLYYSLSDTPFPVAANNSEMVKNIENFDYEKYKEKAKDFIKGKGCIDDGHASERVVELIKKITQENKKMRRI